MKIRREIEFRLMVVPVTSAGDPVYESAVPATEEDLAAAGFVPRELRDVQAVYSMFDETRHRLLRILGEPDVGKGWNHVESSVRAMRDQIESFRLEQPPAGFVDDGEED